MSNKWILLIAVVAVCTCWSGLVNDEAMVEEINAMNTTWRAAASKRFIGTKIEEIRGMLGAELMTEEEVMKYKRYVISRSGLPEAFDLRTKHPKCKTIREIRDQGACGSCWAVAAAEVISDRICIHSQMEWQPKISGSHLISCCTTCGQGCNGGNPTLAFMYWYAKGIPTGGAYGDKKSCQPYTFPPCNHKDTPGPYQPCGTKPLPTPKCKEECIKEYTRPFDVDLWFGKEAYMIGVNEYEIMTEIYDNGSVTASFMVYEDFALYKKGVYQHVIGKALGGHAVKIIGWGVENGVKYWLCVNSWNNNWGDKGYFKILKGKNHCKIEENISAAIPNFYRFEQ